MIRYRYYLATSELLFLLSTTQIVASYFLLQTTFHNPSLTPNNGKQEKEEKDKLTTIDSIFRNRYVCCYF